MSAQDIIRTNVERITASNWMPSTRGWLYLAILLGMVVLPFGVNAFLLYLATFVLFSIVMAQGYNLIGGFAGYPSFGHAAFLGTGAYTSAILINQFGIPYFVTIPVAGVFAGILALLLVPLLRLRGHYFAIASIGFQVALLNVVDTVGWLGNNGGWAMVTQFDNFDYYYAFLGLATATMLTIFLIQRSKFGFGLKAQSLNETQAEMVGIPTNYYKTFAFILSAILPGIAGALYSGWLGFINTATVFDLTLSLNMIIYNLLGGIGTLWGPAIGAILLEITNQVIWSNLPNTHIIVYGVVIILTTLYLSDGLVGAYSKFRERVGS